MNRYINVDEIKHDIDLVWFHRQDIPDDAIVKMLEHIDKEPAADVVEVRHGHWEQDGHHIRCSECGIYFCDTDREGDSFPKEYCPNCGAKMDGEEQENE